MVQTFSTSAPPFNDLVLNSSGSLTMLSGIEAVAQACTNACLTQLGECVLQTGNGLPNFGLIWVGVPDVAIWQTYLQQTMIDVPGVTQVDSVNLTIENKVLTYVAVIQTVYGATTVTGAISP